MDLGFERLALITIVCQADTPTAAQRKQLADFMKTHAKDMDAITGSAMVLDSALARGALTALNWLFRKPFPEKVFSSADPALEWLREKDSEIDSAALWAGLKAAVPDGELVLP